MACVEFVMNRLYDFTRNGKYKVSVRRINILSPKGDGFEKSLSILSNTLEITVDKSLGEPRGFREKPCGCEQEHLWLNCPEDRKILDFRFGTHQDRLDDVKWLAEKRSHTAVPFFVRRIVNTLADDTVDTSAKLELAAISAAIGQIGDQKALPAVNRVCDFLSNSPPTWSESMHIAVSSRPFMAWLH